MYLDYQDCRLLPLYRHYQKRLLYLENQRCRFQLHRDHQPRHRYQLLVQNQLRPDYQQDHHRVRTDTRPGHLHHHRHLNLRYLQCLGYRDYPLSRQYHQYRQRRLYLDYPGYPMNQRCRDYQLHRRYRQFHLDQQHHLYQDYQQFQGCRLYQDYLQIQRCLQYHPDLLNR